MLKIGLFAELAQVSIRTLRHYDHIGLLKPDHVDVASGHRYYTLNQLMRLNRILALKELGLSLNQIQQLLDDNISAEEIQGMLVLRRMELAEMIETGQKRLNEVESRLRQIKEQGRIGEFDIVVKTVPHQTMAYLRCPIHSTSDIMSTYFELYEHVRSQPIKTRHSIGIFHAGHLQKSFRTYPLPYNIEPDGMECGVIIEMSMEEARDLLNDTPVCVRLLPAVREMACVMYHGNLHERSAANFAAYNWAFDHQCWFDGCVREVYHRVAEDDTTHPDNLVEIQYGIIEDQGN